MLKCYHAIVRTIRPSLPNNPMNPEMTSFDFPSHFVLRLLTFSRIRTSFSCGGKKERKNNNKVHYMLNSKAIHACSKPTDSGPSEAGTEHKTSLQTAEESATNINFSKHM